MPNSGFVSDALEKFLGKKKKKEEKPESESSRPWDSPEMRARVRKPKPTPIPNAPDVTDEDDLATKEAKRLEKRNKKIDERVGGWSRKNPRE